MKYTHEERLEIGRRIYTGEISKYQAAAEYEINYQTARNYTRNPYRKKTQRLRNTGGLRKSLIRMIPN